MTMKKIQIIAFAALVLICAVFALGIAPIAYAEPSAMFTVPFLIGAALTADRNTIAREGKTYSLGVAASTKIYAGSLVALNSSGYAVPASDTAGLRIRGRATEQVDNSSGAAGALSVLVDEGVFKFAASGLTAADVGKTALVTDDQTISILDTTNNVKAGLIVAIESATEAWVKVGAEGKAVKDAVSYKAVAITVTAAATSGSSAADADLKDGVIIGSYPTGNQDQHIDSVVLNADGSVTVTLAAAATANNTFNVVVLRATG